jgi:hypothetical protein
MIENSSLQGHAALAALQPTGMARVHPQEREPDKPADQLRREGISGKGSGSDAPESPAPESEGQSQTSVGGPSAQELSQSERALLVELKTRDGKVRQHERAHIAAGGSCVRGGASYTYRTGPDGKRYVVGGEVSIDTSPESEPSETIRKMQTVRRAALAPANPSTQDRAVAAQAAMVTADAQMELIRLGQEGKADPQDPGAQPVTGREPALDLYA